MKYYRKAETFHEFVSHKKSEAIRIVYVASFSKDEVPLHAESMTRPTGSFHNLFLGLLPGSTAWEIPLISFHSMSFLFQSSGAAGSVLKIINKSLPFFTKACLSNFIHISK